MKDFINRKPLIWKPLNRKPEESREAPEENEEGAVRRETAWIQFKIKPKNKQDARMDVYLSASHFEAKASFYPAQEKGRPFTKEYVDLVLKKTGICHGVEYKAIDDATDLCDSSGEAVTDVIIARGFIPANDSPAYFKINAALGRPDAPKELAGGKIDYRSVSPYVLVNAGDEIARLQPAVTGRPGRTVTGRAVPFKKIPRRELLEGEGVCIENDCVYAKTAGRLRIDGGTISVERELRIQKNIGYATGNILFTGDVVLEGDVSDGFKVHSGGSITALKTIAATDFLSKGHIKAAGGLIGRGASVIKASGCVYAKYIQNCRIACKENVTVVNEIINSTIWTLGTLDLGGKGSFVGSEVYALRGFNAGDVGRRGAKPAKICLGADWALLREIQKDEHALRLLKRKLEALKKAQAASIAARTALIAAQTREYAQKLLVEYRAVSTRLAGRKKNFRQDYTAQARVTGKVCAGTLVEICGAAYRAQEDMRNVRFALDAGRKQITVKQG